MSSSLSPSSSSLSRRAPRMRRLREAEENDADLWEIVAQWGLLTSNIVLSVVGLALALLGVLSLTSSTYREVASVLETESLELSSYALLATAGVLVLLAIVGCLGAFAESRALLIIYYVGMWMVFLGLIISLFFSIRYSSRLSGQLKSQMRNTALHKYDPEDVSNEITRSWDALQTRWQCCGLLTSDDSGQCLRGFRGGQCIWSLNTRLNSGEADRHLPTSCCSSREDDCTIDNEEAKANDCYEAVKEGMSGFVSALIILSSIFVIAVILATSLAIAMFFLVDDDDQQT